VGWIYLLIGIALIYWFSKNKNISTTQSNDMLHTQSTSSLVAPPAQALELDPEILRIQKEAEAKRKHAQDLGLPELFSKLYFEKIEYYPAWKERKFVDHVPDMIEEAKELKTEDVNKFLKDVGETVHDKYMKGVRLTIKGNTYVLTERDESSFMEYMEKDFMGYTYLELFENNKSVLLLEFKHYSHEWGSSHHPYRIEGFIEGDWIQLFKTIGQEAERLSKLSDARWKKEQAERDAKKMKKNFGL